LAIKRWNPLFARLREVQESYFERPKLMSCAVATVGGYVKQRIAMSNNVHCTAEKNDAHF
jgi:hypothetical protein